MAQKSKIVAEICLYGVRSTGAGWIAQIADDVREADGVKRLIGDGEPRQDRTFTDAVWQACQAIRDLLAPRGRDVSRDVVRVYDTGGKRFAEIDLTCPPNYGCLTWERAPVFVLSMEEIIAASQK